MSHHEGKHLLQGNPGFLGCVQLTFQSRWVPLFFDLSLVRVKVFWHMCVSETPSLSEPSSDLNYVAVLSPGPSV